MSTKPGHAPASRRRAKSLIADGLRVCYILPVMPASDKHTGKRKALEALGCLLYVIAALVLAAVFLARFGKMAGG
ncbi:MAG: hypothetical protein JSV00_09955 [bacterium]|nr:MAG: hypothetical protein JSV00_09955 [bacterium]